jgi:ubiquinone/menaquinone biosynthesis C-methylase UbiE
MKLSEFWNKPGPSHKWGESALSKEMMGDLIEWFKGWEEGELTVLDIGSGSGRLFNCLSEAKVNADVTMVDWSEAGRKLCLKNTGYEPDTWDGLVLPYADDSFDIVVMSDFLLHVRPKNLKVVMSEAIRVCKLIMYFNLTTWDNPKYDKNTWCFSHNTLFQTTLLEDADILWEKQYVAKNPKNTLAAYIMHLRKDERVEESDEVIEEEDDTSQKQREYDGDTERDDSPSSDESSVSDDSEVG